MQALQLTTARREAVRSVGPGALLGAPTRLDARRSAPPLSCDLFRSAGIVPAAAGGAPTRAGGDLSRGSPPRG
jgi:hypothetical protein